MTDHKLSPKEIKAARKDQIVKIISEENLAKIWTDVKALGKKLECSPTSVKRYLAELVTEERLVTETLLTGKGGWKLPVPKTVIEEPTDETSDSEVFPGKDEAEKIVDAREKEEITELHDDEWTRASTDVLTIMDKLTETATLSSILTTMSSYDFPEINLPTLNGLMKEMYVDGLLERKKIDGVYSYKISQRGHDLIKVDTESQKIISEDDRFKPAELTDEEINDLQDKILQGLFAARMTGAEARSEYVRPAAIAAEFLPELEPAKAEKTIWGILIRMDRDKFIGNAVHEGERQYCISEKGMRAIKKRQEVSVIKAETKIPVENEVGTYDDPKTVAKKTTEPKAFDIAPPAPSTRKAPAPVPGKKTTATTSTRKAPKPGRKKKSKRFSRTDSFVAVINDKSSGVRTYEELCEKADEVYVENGGRSNMRETKWYGNIIYNTLVGIGSIVENEDGAFIIN